MHRSRTLTTIAAGMLALIPLAAGCSGDDRDPAEPDLAPASTSASTTTETTSAPPSTTESASGTASPTTSSTAPETDETEQAEQAEQEEAAPTAGSCISPATEAGLPELTIAAYCDGVWAQVAKPGTDDFRVLRWDGTWHEYENLGRIKMGLAQQCYEPEIADADGMPQELRDQLPVCD